MPPNVEPKPDDKPGTNDGTPPSPPTIDLEAATKLAGEAAEAAAKGAVAGVVDALPSPAPAASGNDAQRQAVITEGMKRYEELSQDGKHAEALTGFLGALTESNRYAPQTDPSTIPELRELRDNIAFRAEQTHKDLYDRYGDEIKARISKLPFKEQTTYASMEREIRAVREAHSGDLESERVEARVKEEMDKRSADFATAPQNIARPDLGESEDTDLHGLDAEQRELAASIGVTYEAWSGQVKAEGTRRNKDGTVDILPRIPRGGTVQPGKF